MKAVTIKENGDETYSVLVDGKVVFGPMTKTEAESKKGQLEAIQVKPKSFGNDDYSY